MSPNHYDDPTSDSYLGILRNQRNDADELPPLLTIPPPRSDTMPSSGQEVGRKDDSGKTRLELVPPRAFFAIGRALTWGANRYGDDNWRKVKGWRRRYAGATLRHIFKWLGGEQIDPDSGEHHLALACCSLMFLIEKEVENEAEG